MKDTLGMTESKRYLTKIARNVIISHSIKHTKFDRFRL